MLNLKIKVL